MGIFTFHFTFIVAGSEYSERDFHVRLPNKLLFWRAIFTFDRQNIPGTDVCVCVWSGTRAITIKTGFLVKAKRRTTVAKILGNFTAIICDSVVTKHKWHITEGFRKPNHVLPCAINSTTKSTSVGIRFYGSHTRRLSIEFIIIPYRSVVGRFTRNNEK